MTQSLSSPQPADLSTHFTYEPSARSARSGPAPDVISGAALPKGRPAIHVQISDRVTLSANARVHQLQQLGRSVSEIAATLGITPVAVDTYLGVTPAGGLQTAPAALPAALPFGPPAALPAQKAG